MRHRFIGGALLAATALLSGPAALQAQIPGYDYRPVTARGQSPTDIGGLGVPINSDPNIPIPTGAAGSAGFYTALETVLLTQQRNIGTQIIAYRGLVDSTGAITGLPGTYLGSGQVGLTTADLGRTTWQPGYRIELGYKFEDGTAVYANWMQLVDANYSVNASSATPFFRSNVSLTDTFLTSGVYNFPPSFAGPGNKTGLDTPGQAVSDAYGVWNGASVMTLKYTQRFSQAEIGGRMPVLQTEYSRVYALAGARYSWFFDRFQWYTAAPNLQGVLRPQDAAFYTNTLSQRMYGPFIGAGHEIFLANQFSMNVDLTGALLLDVEKERAKYKLASSVLNPVAAKRSWNDYSLVPNANASVNLQWYPIEGVQIRVGYTAMTFFNTRKMEEPVGFNYGAIDPQYSTQVFRIIHGLNVGIGLFF